VIIVSYNNEPVIAECVGSVLRQSHDDYEVILVDNASTDNTVMLVRSTFPSVRIHVTERNLGFPAAVNLGAKLARGKILAVLNPDTKVDVDWLRELTRVLDSDSRVGAVTSKVLLYGSSRINAMGMDIHVSGLGLNRGLGEVDDGGDATIREVPCIHGSSFACSKRVFEEVGGLEESFFLYVDDVYFSLQLRLAGYKILLNPKSRVYHRYYLEVGPEKFYFLERNRVLVLLGILRIPTVLLLSPILLLTEILAIVYATKMGRSYLRAKAKAWKGIFLALGPLKRRRSLAQEIRRVSDATIVRLFRFGMSGAIVRDALRASSPRRILSL